MSNYYIKKDDSFFLLVDVQERLFKAMQDNVQEMLKRNCSILLNTAGEMNIPVLVSEQYRKGLGETIPEFPDLRIWKRYILTVQKMKKFLKL